MKLYAEPGESVACYIQRCIACANRTRQEVEFKHNDIELRVYPGSHAYDIADKHHLKYQLLRAIGER